MKTDGIKTDKVNTGTDTGKVFAQVERAKSKVMPTVSPEEAAERRRNMKTQGVKGAKLPRLTLTFSDDNYKYLHVMARIQGKSINLFLNDLIDASREKNADIYEEAQRLTQRIRK